MAQPEEAAKKVEAELEDLVKNDMINSWMGFKGPEGFWDGRVVTNGIDGFFKISKRGSTIMTEIRAGTASFMTLCYILAVHPRILSESGGPCVCGAETAADPDCVFYDGVYAECVEDFRRELVTVTAAASCIACVTMGLFGNLPFLLAPGMGLNAYFTYDVVGFHGTGKVKWRTAMAAIFIEGIIFMLLTISGLRLAFAKAIPSCIKVATTGGIGFFLAHLGLQTAEGIGLVVTDVATGITLGGCPPAARSYATYPPSPVTADAYTCDNNPGSQMTSATTWLGIMTLCIIGILMKRGIRGGIIIGILMATFISWIPNTLVSYWSDSVYPLGGGGGLQGGEYRWNYFKQVVKVERIQMAGAQMDFNFNDPNLGIALFTFLYVDLLDTTGTLFAMAKFMNIIQPNGKFEGDQKAFMVDGFSTMIGAVLGTSPVTTFIESAPGIEEGGRTGLTAIWSGFLFFISLFFAPLLASIPPWATGPALIVVGAMMMRGLVNINWYNHGEAIPAFVCIALMPLTYSIAYGIIGGLFVYVVLNGFDWLLAFAFGPSPEAENPAEMTAVARAEELASEKVAVSRDAAASRDIETPAPQAEAVPAPIPAGYPGAAQVPPMGFNGMPMAFPPMGGSPAPQMPMGGYPVMGMPPPGMGQYGY
uniref:Xanthine/uracil/vitamin C permease n=2 Tax=Hemiselmis andersenii TaxID=464988 RepID=A0A7S0U1C1_HEMAN|mmetsp:Transcript_31483/g.73304  ORF Transcript_31483/g.73304 Transcript_31483/m.73304 type:complete len:648 (+) Transcript_31483:68-2011(+)